MTVMDLTSNSRPVSSDPEAWVDAPTAGSEGDAVPADEQACDCGQTGCTAWVVKAEAGYVIQDDDGEMT